MSIKARDVLVGRQYLMSTGEIRKVLRAVGERVEYTSNAQPLRHKGTREAFAADATREITPSR
jgi:hypothetical protein